MNEHDNVRNEVREILVAIDSEGIASDQLSRLDKLLLNCPDAATEAVEMLHQQAELSELMRCDSLVGIAVPHKLLMSSQETSDGGGIASNFRSKFASWGSLLKIAACLLVSHFAVAAIVWSELFLPGNDDAVVVSSDALPPDDSMALRLISATACIWESPESGMASIGTAISDGQRFTLREGIAELRLQTLDGVVGRVSVEGPSSVIAGTKGLFDLRFGAIVVDLFQLGESLNVNTSHGNVLVAPSSSVGIVSDDHRVEVHVFSGKVEILLGPGEVFLGNDVITVQGGDAVIIARDVSGGLVVSQAKASTSEFASTSSMTFDSLDISKAYTEAVLASRPAIYWRFEEKGIVANLGSAVGMELSAIKSVRRGGGEGNHVAEFGLTPQSGVLTTEGRWPTRPLESYTAELWVKPSHYHQGMFLSCMGPLIKNGKLMGESHGLGIQAYGPLDSYAQCIFRYIHRSPVESFPMAGEECRTKDYYRVREWQHVVARKNGPDLQLFVNGELVARERNRTPLPSGLRIIVGARTQVGPDLREFVGQLDEIALYEYPLTDEEIRRHYELVKCFLENSEKEFFVPLAYRHSRHF